MQVEGMYIIMRFGRRSETASECKMNHVGHQRLATLEATKPTGSRLPVAHPVPVADMAAEPVSAQRHPERMLRATPPAVKSPG